MLILKRIVSSLCVEHYPHILLFSHLPKTLLFDVVKFGGKTGKNPLPTFSCADNWLDHDKPHKSHQAA